MRKRMHGKATTTYNFAAFTKRDVKGFYRGLGRRVQKSTAARALEIRRFGYFETQGGEVSKVAVHEWRRTVKVKKKKSERGFLLVEAIVAVGIMGLMMYIFARSVDFQLGMLIAERLKGEALLVKLENIATPFSKHVKVGDPPTDCRVPVACAHGAANAKTFQSCGEDCVIVSGQWHLDGQPCTRGMICTGS